MPKLRVTIIDEVRNRRLKVDLPDDAAMEKLLPALAKKLGLPTTDPGGQPIAYRLTHEATGRALGGDQTLASFGVLEGDALRLAAAREEEEAVPLWQKVPVWGWVGIGGVIFLVVAALAFLVGREAKPEPTPTVVAEVTTTAVAEAPTPPALTPTATPAPPTSVPTSTPLPTATPVPPPTDTPVPPAPVPTATPQPTPTPVPPTEAPPPPLEGPIKIGVQAPITGWAAYEGEGFVKVLELAVEQKNAAGGILGRQIEIVTCDDMGKPEESSKCAQQLVSEGVDAVVGSYLSICTEPASAIYNEANILQVTPSSTYPRLTTYGYKQFFRVCFLDDQLGLFAAKFIKEDLGVDKVAFLHDNSTYGQGLAEWAKRYYEEEYGGTSVFYDAINPEDTDFTPILTKIMEANPGAVYFTGFYLQGGLLLKQSRDLGVEWKWVLGDACSNPELVEIAGKEAAAGTYFTTEPLPKDIPYSEAQAFVRVYKAKYGEDLASIWWLMVADAFNVIAAAMEATGRTDTDAMAEYLHTEFKDYPGVTGPIIGYDEKGDRLGTGHVAYVISADGECVPY